MAAAKKSRKPFQTVKSGSVSIPIYRGSVRGENGRNYDAFTVAAYIGDKRHRWTFGDQKDALAMAELGR